MRLKDYQRETLDTLGVYLKRVDVAWGDYWAVSNALTGQSEEARAAALANLQPPVVAWKWVQTYGKCASPDEWRSLKDGVGNEIPHICLELPTGSGKTLIAAHAAGKILAGLDKAMTGFVLWVVPSDAIYRQTLKSLRDRGSPIRVALETASGGRVKILEKMDSFTKADVENELCVMLLMLQAAGRRDKETLKVFRNSGKFQSFFPQADDLLALEALRARVPNLDGFDLADAETDREASAGVKQSLGNVLRIIRPIIVLDEGHKTYTETQRGTLAGFNPRFLLELTATPDRQHSNILVNINGQRLKDEEMVKLPIQLEADENADWRDTLAAALKRLDEPDLARRLGSVIPNPWVAMSLVRSAVATLLERADDDESVVAKVRLNLTDSMKVELRQKVEAEARAVFDRKVAEGTIQFRLRGLEWSDLNWSMPQQVPFNMSSGDKWLRDAHDDPAQLTLFEKVPAKEFNGFEKDVALHLNRKCDVVTWWWRIVARKDWGLQGWQRHKVYPDFLVRLDPEAKTAKLLALETKGKQLDNEDTAYKRNLFAALEAAYAAGKDLGEVELVDDAPETMRFRILVQEDDWKPKVDTALI